MEQISSDELKLRHERIASIKLILGEEKSIVELNAVLRASIGHVLLQMGTVIRLLQIARSTRESTGDLLRRLDPNVSLWGYPIGMIAGQQMSQQLAAIRANIGRIESELLSIT